jgi:Ca-activated chloride channel homolog
MKRHPVLRKSGCAVLLLPMIVLVLAGFETGYAEKLPGGTLHAYGADQKDLGFCPLEHTAVSVDISGFIARVTLVQKFTNPWSAEEAGGAGAIEAVYTFPMSDRAAVDRMEMRAGDRVIRGVVREKEEARKIYERARDAGQAASLLDQERPNIFTQSVANIMPGQAIEITISYVEYLEYEDGEYEVSFPMVAGPRYMPGAPADSGTTQVPDANRIAPPVTPEGTRAGHDISLAVTIDGGMPVTDIASELHAVDIEKPAADRALVRLKNQKTIPNRDFVLRYRLAGEEIRDAVLTHYSEKGGFFSLVLEPPAKVMPEEAAPKEMIFVIDCSGSMRGFPIGKAKKTMRLCIENMNPNDTFNLISFAGGTGYCFPEPVANTKANREKALAYLEGLEGRGGTEMMKAINAALGGGRSDERLRIVCFMTDGFIGNDMAILGAVQKHAETARVFAFGIGNSVNRFLIENMAREGRGASEIVTLESSGDEAAGRFYERVHSPVLTDITVDFEGLEVDDVQPAADRIPDLFSSRPLVLTGRYTAPGSGEIVLRGQTADGAFERRIPVTLPADAPGHDVLASLWARKKIGAIMAENWQGIQSGNPPEELKQRLVTLGVDYSLVTQYTSFVAVEERVINEDGEVKRVEVPVEMPDGVSYDGVFGGQRRGQANAVAGKSLGYARSKSDSTWGVSNAETAQALPTPMPPALPKPARKPGLKPSPQPVETVADEDAAPVAHPKLDPALHNLPAKLTNGSYRSADSRVVVKNGVLEVFILLEEDSEAVLDALRAAGADVVSVRRGGRITVLAKVEAADLVKIASVTGVKKVTPPAY